MLERSRLLAVLRAIAAGAPLVASSCACPKPTRTLLATHHTDRLPDGDFDLHGCAGGGDEVVCRYEHEANRLHAVVQVVRCGDVCPGASVCDGDGHEIACRIEGEELRVRMPRRLEDPGQYVGNCTGGDPYPCQYTSSNHPDRTVYLESLAGFGPSFEDGNDTYWCELDPATGDVGCWHGRYLDCKAGRRPDGDVTTRWNGAAQLVLEAASVPAFDALARELDLHGAPPALVAAARSAMRDEMRHAALVAGLVGAGPVEVRVERREPRDLAAIALDNAREGCAGEALAAIAAHAVANRAAGVERAALAAIARDEARHALLSFAIDDWARARLGARARGALDEAWRDEVHRAIVHR